MNDWGLITEGSDQLGSDSEDLEQEEDIDDSLVEQRGLVFTPGKFRGAWMRIYHSIITSLS